MISESTYNVLKNIPRTPGESSLNALHKICGMDVSLLSEILVDAESCNLIQFKHKDHTASTAYRICRSDGIFLTEEGQIAIEEYQNAEKSRRMADESLKTAKAAKRAAIASAIAAGAALIAQLPEFIKLLCQLFSRAS